MLTSNNSLSGDSTKSSGSSSDLRDGYGMCLDDEKTFTHTINGEYVSLNGSGKDEIYWERRRKNNAAAKRSRERRRQHDMELEKQIYELKSLNSSLRKELLILKEKLAMNETLKENHDIPQFFFQSIGEVSSVQLFSSACTSPCLISPKNSFDETAMKTTDSFAIVSNKNMDPIYVNNIPGLMFHQNPLDLSCKAKEQQIFPEAVIKNQPKTIHRSNTQVTLDQKYWDRRRRNNEAVRKCRQNKRARIINSLITNKADSDQIQIKIETISSELEKIKSHFKNSEQTSLDFSTSSTVSSETIEKEAPKNIGTQMIKWKTKLIKADQADKEMY